jgi:hypothetical protein
LKTSEQIYWIKTVLAAITGFICYYVQVSLEIQSQIVLMIGITLYIAYSESLAIIFKVDRNRTIKIALGAFLFIWILIWTLLTTLGQFGWF